jgi:hypothetical protein
MCSNFARTKGSVFEIYNDLILARLMPSGARMENVSL